MANKFISDDDVVYKIEDSLYNKISTKYTLINKHMNKKNLAYNCMEQ